MQIGNHFQVSLKMPKDLGSHVKKEDLKDQHVELILKEIENQVSLILKHLGYTDLCAGKNN